MADPVAAAADKVLSQTPVTAAMYYQLLCAATCAFTKAFMSRHLAGVQDLVQRLESITIHWTRQIKEVVNQQVHILFHSHDASSIGATTSSVLWCLSGT